MLLSVSFVSMLLLIITAVFFIIYALLIIYYWQSWKAIPIFTPGHQPQTKISIIIPARNEQENIAVLLQSLQGQDYPKELFEIIVIDDNSTDATAEIVKGFSGIKLIQLKEEGLNSYKKKAIETGIAAANGHLIVTTDADCMAGPKWLNTIAGFKEKKQSVFIAAPVTILPSPQRGEGLGVRLFQTMDFMILQGITGAAVHKRKLTMCNGANLAYEKKAFDEVNGFRGIDNIASGDDMLLMHKIWKQHPDEVHYLKSREAIISTRAVTTWKAFFNQRIRWASKAKKYDDKRIFWVLMLVYLFNLSFLVLLLAGFWLPGAWIYLIGLWVAKTLVELPFIYSLASFFNKQSLVKYFFFFQPLHIVYTVFSGLFGQFGKYEWKGRKVK